MLYAALFEYPLTLAQLRQTLIESTETASEILCIYSHSPGLQAAIDCREGYFFPRGDNMLVSFRKVGRRASDNAACLAARAGR